MALIEKLAGNLALDRRRVVRLSFVSVQCVRPHGLGEEIAVYV